MPAAGHLHAGNAVGELGSFPTHWKIYLCSASHLHDGLAQIVDDDQAGGELQEQDVRREDDGCGVDRSNASINSDRKHSMI